jgi:hypothetical protein
MYNNIYYGLFSEYTFERNPDVRILAQVIIQGTNFPAILLPKRLGLASDLACSSNELLG